MDALSTQTAGWLRPPTTLEWHYAARAGSGAWWTRMTEQELRQHDILKEDALSKEGTLRANGFGLHDMIGSVAEWCEHRIAEPGETMTDYVLLGGSRSATSDSVRRSDFLDILGRPTRLLEGGPDQGMRPVRTLCR